MPADRTISDAGTTDGADARRLGGGEGAYGSPAEWLEQAVQAEPAGFTTPGEPHTCTEQTHSRLADGRQLCWRPSGSGSLRLAIDAEMVGQPVPRALARRAATDDPLEFWPLWTRAEVRAKLHGIPIIQWLGLVDWQADGDLAAPLESPLDVVTVVGASVVLSYGVTPVSLAAILT